MIRINRPSCPNPGSLSSGNYKHKDNKDALISANSGKCMYCESKVVSTYYGDIEHIKPKSKYKHLEYEWANLGFVCAKCNGAKGDKFHEDTPYINPYDEDPRDHIFFFGVFLKQKRGSERGEITILDIDLNRPPLVERRMERSEKIEASLKVCFRTKNEQLKENALNALRKEADADREYSLCIRTLLDLNRVA